MSQGQGQPASAPAMPETPFPTVSNSQECPLFHFYKSSTPNAMFWNAPKGCVCVSGMSGINCGMCSGKDGGRSPCQHFTDNHCRLDAAYERGDHYKAYNCKLTSKNSNKWVKQLTPEPMMDLYVNITTGSGTMVIYGGDDVNKEASHVARCEIKGCVFPPGDKNTNGSCESIGCKCVASNQCSSSYAKALLEVSMIDQPVDVIVLPHTGYRNHDGYYPHQMEMNIAGLDAPIEAFCDASACSQIPCTDDSCHAKSTSLSSSNGDEQDNRSVNLGLAVGLLVVGFVAVVGIALLLLRQRKSKKEYDGVMFPEMT